MTNLNKVKQTFLFYYTKILLIFHTIFVMKNVKYLCKCLAYDLNSILSFKGIRNFLKENTFKKIFWFGIIFLFLPYVYIFWFFCILYKYIFKYFFLVLNIFFLDCCINNYISDCYLKIRKILYKIFFDPFFIIIPLKFKKFKENLSIFIFIDMILRVCLNILSKFFKFFMFFFNIIFKLVRICYTYSIDFDVRYRWQKHKLLLKFFNFKVNIKKFYYKSIFNLKLNYYYCCYFILDYIFLLWSLFIHKFKFMNKWLYHLDYIILKLIYMNNNFGIYWRSLKSFSLYLYIYWSCEQLYVSNIYICKYFWQLHCVDSLLIILQYFNKTNFIYYFTKVSLNSLYYLYFFISVLICYFSKLFLFFKLIGWILLNKFNN